MCGRHTVCNEWVGNLLIVVVVGPIELSQVQCGRR